MAKAKRTPEEKKALAWVNEYWRPAAAIVYLLICICDFIVFPLIFGLQEANVREVALAVKDLDPQVAAVLAAPHPQWQPLTLMGNGFFHIAFGAIVGITAWTRGAEKIEDIRSNYVNGYGPSPYSPYQQPYYYQQPYQQPYQQSSVDWSQQSVTPMMANRPGGVNQQMPPASGNDGQPIDNPDIPEGDVP